MKMIDLFEVNGTLYPVNGYETTNTQGVVPIVELPLMSDEKWVEMCRRDFLTAYEAIHGKQAKYPENAFENHCKEIREWDNMSLTNKVPVIYCA